MEGGPRGPLSGMTESQSGLRIGAGRKFSFPF
ncbi:hypothetical protein KYC_08585 [Achromobacter arsenitoxydans SY8]|uniref:Uncharacterized protein n=1 Tax=Achromobacter arsenitoxydans SY8 TaxID=477184 RepID=H0F4M5_9BURK|nr:hypothetical protein KYC_08585 [Achromobacter arsenitoxydans SY8]